MNDLVLLLHEPYTRRHRELFGIDALRSRGFNVAVWDVSAYVFPRLRLVDTLDHEAYVVRLTTVDAFAERLRQTDVAHTVFIVECVLNWRTRHIHRLMAEACCRRVRIDLFANNVIPEPMSLRIRRLLSPVGPDVVRGKMARALMRVYCAAHHIGPLERYFSSSALSARTDAINHPDYEVYRDELSRPTTARALAGLPDEGYIVFCDNYFPLHPDYAIYHHRRRMPAAAAYRRSMCRLFDRLERMTGLPVVVAAHPKSDYRGDEFGEGRRIVKYRTGPLVVHAYAVVLHASNAVSFAALADRRTLFVTTSGFDSLMRLRVRLRALATLLGKPVIDVDHDDLSHLDLSVIDDHLRRDYIRTYLTDAPTAELRNVDIIADALS